jgi:DNA topoisomerase-2
MSTRTEQVSKKYQKKTHLEHIKERPDTYVGSCEARNECMWVMESGKLKKREVQFVPGLLKIFDEILVNAADNKRRDPSMRAIKVSIRPDSISVENDGAGVPVVMHDTHKVYVPELVFGHLLSGDNYDDSSDRVVGGRNGYGAKLANIFSTTFCVETVDSKSKKKYAQTWHNNMGSCSKPKINASGKRKDFTKVSFVPDFARFGLQNLTEDMQALFRKRVYDIAGTTPPDVRVYLNGERLPISNFKQYCSLYFEDEQKVVYEQINERWEVCVTVAPDQQAQQVSFCNAICTTKGGEHVRVILDEISKHVIPLKAFKDLSVKTSQVRNSTFVFVNALIANPSFDSQTKETLTTKASKFGPVQYKPKISDKFAKAICKRSGIVEEILYFARAKSQRALEKKTGARKKTKLSGIPKLDDANFAGGRRSQECTLILTEGDSAKSLAIAGLSVIGRDKYGVFPLKGKLLNVRDASNSSVMNNAEIQNIMKIMGLNIGRTYSDTSMLRYGHIMIMTDQDHDGSHIKGLIINFLHHFWPSLLAIPNFLQVFITPIVKCTRGSVQHTFYTTPEYDQWCLQNDVTGWRIKYYKGLGTSSAKEAKEYFSNLHKNRLQFETMTDDNGKLIDMCFNKQRVADRKQWISSYEAGTYMDFTVQQMSYVDFVNKEYIIMAVQSNLRGIPNVLDGLKPSTRKILYACLKRGLRQEIKVAQLAGYTSEHAAYHHGEASLNNAIIGMAQNYVGSNNIALLQPNGQFGTRLLGGKDAASPRYIFTQLGSLTEKLFRPEDMPLYEPLKDDGQYIEPKYYLPIIPMLLVNGANGIGTGWSSQVPPHNPIDIIHALKAMIHGQSVPELKPWFQGFNGTVTKVPDSTKWNVTGTWNWSNACTLHVTELPVGTWTNSYKEYLEKGLDGHRPFKKDTLKEVKCNYTDTTIDFKIKMSPQAATKYRADQALLLKDFKLKSTIDTGNMHAFGAKGLMKKFNSVNDILSEFFVARLDLYHKRKQYQMKILQTKLEKEQHKIRFINLIVNQNLSFRNKTKGVLLTELEQLHFPSESHDYLLGMSLWSMTHDKIEQLKHEQLSTKNKLDTLKETPTQKLWLDDIAELQNCFETRKRSAAFSSDTNVSNKKRKR